MSEFFKSLIVKLTFELQTLYRYPYYCLRLEFFLLCLFSVSRVFVCV